MTAESPPRPSPLASRRRALIVLALIATVAAIPARGRPAPPPRSLRVNPSTAPAAVLEALPRIGPVLAARIVEERPFVNLDDLDNRVRGIGPVTREGLRPYLRFDGPSAPPTKDR